MNEASMAGVRGRRSLVVAVTGHTNVGDESAVRALVNRALREMKSAADDAVAQQCQRLGVKPSTRTSARTFIISCLAAGADQLVASEGLELGYTLLAVLPGHADAYRQTIRFPDDPQRQANSRAQFDRLLHAANGRTNDLAMPLPTGDAPADEQLRHNAYDAATRAMLRQCDILIALIDILHRKKLRATGDAVRYALRAGIPILWIDPSRPDELRWLSHLSEEQFAAIANDPPDRRIVLPIAPDPASSFVSTTLATQIASILG
jgi:hypothetical protein